MIRRSLLTFLFFSFTAAHAQFSVQESDSANKLSIFGRDVNFNFFNLTSVETDKMNDDGGRISTYNQVTASSYVSYNYRLSLRVPFQFNTSGTDRFNGEKVNEQETSLQDIIIGMQNYELLMLPADLSLYWEGRLYLPTSPNSKQSGLITRYRNEFILSRVFTRHFEMEFSNKFSYFFQSRSTYQNTYRDGFDYERTSASATKKMEVENRLAAWGKIDAETGIGWQLGTKETYVNESDAEDKHNPGRRELKTGPSIRFPFTKNANFIFNYEDVVDRENAKQLGKFYADNTQFTLLSFIKF